MAFLDPFFLAAKVTLFTTRNMACFLNILSLTFVRRCSALYYGHLGQNHAPNHLPPSFQVQKSETGPWTCLYILMSHSSDDIKASRNYRNYISGMTLIRWVMTVITCRHSLQKVNCLVLINPPFLPLSWKERWANMLLYHMDLPCADNMITQNDLGM